MPSSCFSRRGWAAFTAVAKNLLDAPSACALGARAVEQLRSLTLPNDKEDISAAVAKLQGISIDVLKDVRHAKTQLENSCIGSTGQPYPVSDKHLKLPTNQRV